MIQHRKLMIITGAIGLTGAFASGVAEWLLFILSMSGFNRIAVGHYIGIISTPLYIAGFYHTYRILRLTSFKLSAWFFFLSVYMIFLMDVWIGSRVYLAESLVYLQGHSDFKNTFSNMLYFSDAVILGVRILLGLVSVLFAGLIFKGNPVYPLWMSLLNPFILMGMIQAVYLYLPVIGKYLQPAAFSLAHFIFFGVSLLLVWRQGRSGSGDS